jgi:hypothetical protein
MKKGKMGRILVGGKANVVEIDLIETLVVGIMSDRDDVIPHLAGTGVYPADSFSVFPNAARAPAVNGEFGVLFDVVFVLKNRDATNDVDVIFVKFGDEPADVRNALLDRAAREEVGVAHFVRDPSGEIFDVDYHRVDLGRVHDVHNAIAHRRRSRNPARHVDRLNRIGDLYVCYGRKSRSCSGIVDRLSLNCGNIDSRRFITDRRKHRRDSGVNKRERSNKKSTVHNVLFFEAFRKLLLIHCSLWVSDYLRRAVPRPFLFSDGVRIAE